MKLDKFHCFSGQKMRNDFLFAIKEEKSASTR